MLAKTVLQYVPKTKRLQHNKNTTFCYCVVTLRIVQCSLSELYSGHHEKSDSEN